MKNLFTILLMIVALPSCGNESNKNAKVEVGSVMEDSLCNGSRYSTCTAKVLVEDTNGDRIEYWTGYLPVYAGQIIQRDCVKELDYNSLEYKSCSRYYWRD